jgi:hypothetical protein
MGIAGGASWNPFEVGRGIQAAGYVGLPLARIGSGKLSYEVLVGLSHARSAAALARGEDTDMAILSAVQARRAGPARPPPPSLPRRCRSR